MVISAIVVCDYKAMDVKEKVFPISHYFDILSGKNELLAYEVLERFYEIGGFEGLEDTENLFVKK